MDINDMRIAVTVVSLVLFLVLVVHTLSKRRKAEFEAAAMLPFADEAAPEHQRGEQS
jgi:cytochrome c oxidase cbb3-type subunit IV